MTRTRKPSRKLGGRLKPAACSRRGVRRFSSAFAKSSATSAVFHIALLTFLAVLYAAESVLPMKPIALSFDKAAEATDDDGPPTEVALDMPQSEWDEDQGNAELLQALSDFQSTTPDVVPAAIEIISEPPLQLAVLSQERLHELNVERDATGNPDNSSFEDGELHRPRTEMTLIRLPAAHGKHSANARGPTSELVPVTEFARRLEAAGAKTGDVQISLAWNTIDDIDLHVTYTPGNGLVDNINWVNRVGRLSSGMLDVDMNAHSGNVSATPVENVFWPPGSSPNGFITVYVHFFRSWSGKAQVPVLVRIKRGEEFTQHSVRAVLNANPQVVKQFEFPNGDSERKF